MSAIGTDCAWPPTHGHPKDRPVPRPGACCRSALVVGIGFATLVLMPTLRPAAAGYPLPSDDPLQAFASELDRDGNGVEDLLDAWRAGRRPFADLRDEAMAAPRREAAKAAADEPATVPEPLKSADGPWARGQVRLIWFDAPGGAITAAAKAAAGRVDVLHDIAAFGATVLACDEAGLAAVLDRAGDGRLMLDRDGVPALDVSRGLVGVPRVRQPGWSLGRDWSSTVAILDSGCDTAHGDLGDHDDDDRDGPPPAVGDAGDWYPADGSWPLFIGYKVVGWTDVSDDFPQAAGPWDYHHHGTALASIVAGNGSVEATYAGIAPASRLTVVKFYDFDVTWHAWAGDFLAACAWVLEHREAYRIGSVLVAVNWDTESGVSMAVGALVRTGLPVVGAVGNHGTDPGGPGYPARLPSVLTVGGVNDAGELSAFSGRGLPTVAKPDLLAPSGGLLPERGRITAADNEPDDAYAGRWGTSLAAAHVAGALALLQEALLDRGVVLPPDRESALTRTILLKATAQPVRQAETADGSGSVTLPAWTGPDQQQGWGLLRIDAAVQAACVPLLPGADQLDTLSADWTRPVAARRLGALPGVRYLVEAVPAQGLDVVLDVVDPLGMIAAAGDVSVRRDAGGPGVSEFVYVEPGASRWLFAAVKRKSGSGTVTLRLREADTFAAQGYRHLLPGRLTGAPNQGRLGAQLQVSLVVPSLVAIDDAARAVTVLNPDGSVRPGWPVFLFPAVSSQGGLGQPLVWDLDAQPGDEIVLSSDYGSVVFFNAAGARTTLNYAFNVPLTAPVGLQGAAERRVACVDANGLVRVWAAGPVLRQQRNLARPAPLVPAAGVLQAGVQESLVLAFADGHLRVLDEDLADRPGWPRDLGQVLEAPPVLVDFDGDGGLEIVLVVRDGASGLASMRVLRADGSAGPGDGVALATPAGGPWIALGPALVTGRYGTGELGVSVLGLAGNGLPGAAARWTLAQGVLRADGTAYAEEISGLDIRTTTAEGRLVLDSRQLPAPVAWNLLGGTGTEAAVLASVHWTEVLYGLTSIPGAATAWYLPVASGRPLATWQPQERSGPDAVAPGFAATLLVPRGDGTHLRIDGLDEYLTAVPVLSGADEQPLWPSARRDGRNSGSYPLDEPVSAVAVVRPGTRLTVFPNPGAGRFRFQVDGEPSVDASQVEIYDLRGRRVRLLNAPQPAELTWDGRDRDGRRLAAGTYLAVVRTAGRSLTTRFVLTR